MTFWNPVSVCLRSSQEQLNALKTPLKDTSSLNLWIHRGFYTGTHTTLSRTLENPQTDHVKVYSLLETTHTLQELLNTQCIKQTPQFNRTTLWPLWNWLCRTPHKPSRAPQECVKPRLTLELQRSHTSLWDPLLCTNGDSFFNNMPTEEWFTFFSLHSRMLFLFRYLKELKAILYCSRSSLNCDSR